MGSKNSKIVKFIDLDNRPGMSIKVPDLGMSVKSSGLRGKPQNTAMQWWGITPCRG